MGGNGFTRKHERPLGNAGRGREHGARILQICGQLLAAAFRFDGSGKPVYWIYGFKTGTFWPFAPTGEKQQRDNARELELKAKLEQELPVEPDLSRWLALYDAPM